MVSEHSKIPGRSPSQWAGNWPITCHKAELRTVPKSMVQSSQIIQHDTQTSLKMLWADISMMRCKHKLISWMELNFLPAKKDLEMTGSSIWNCQTHYFTHYRQTSSIRRASVGDIFILDLALGFNGLGKDNCKTRRQIFSFCEIGATYIRSLTELDS